MPPKRLATGPTGKGKGVQGSGSGAFPTSAPSPTPVDRRAALAKERDYQAEDDFRTLERGEDVRSDADRHTRALAHGHRKMASMTRVIAKSVGTRNGKRKLSRTTVGGRR